jgi:hypothetical protein
MSAASRRRILNKRRFENTTRPSKRTIRRTQNKYLNKGINIRRDRLGLPPLTLNKITENNTDPTSYQWDAFTAYNWSYLKSFHHIARSSLSGTTTSYTRQSDRLKLLPFEFKCPMYQVASTQHVYRFLIIRVSNMTLSTNLQPTDIFNDTGSALAACFSSLKQVEDRDTFGGSTITRLHFKVLTDKRFIWNTTPGAPGSAQYRTIKMRVPAQKVVYDPDVDDGTVARNYDMLVIVTTATEDSASYTHGRNYHMKFVDLV